MFEEFSNAVDTSSEAEEILIGKMRGMSPTEKIKNMLELCTMARAMVLSGIKQRYTGISDEELKKRFAAIVLGKEFTKRYYQWDPDIEGY